MDRKLKSESRYIKSDFSHVSDSEFAEIDLLIGVTGESIISPKTWESWILNSKHKQLFIASGSTKTVEFADFIKWINELNLSENPKLSGEDLTISFHRILDPQTQMDLGSRILFRIEKNKSKKKCFLLVMEVR